MRLLARPSSIRTLLLSGFVVLFRILWGSFLLRVVFVGLLSSVTGSFFRAFFFFFFFAFFYLAIVVIVLFSISYGSFNSECFLEG